jgi:multisubunit Na+/H+ antiporter MnhC subunit
MPTGKLRAVIAVVIGFLILVTPNIVVYIIGLGLIAYGVNELFPELKTQVRDYLRGGRE